MARTRTASENRCTGTEPNHGPSRTAVCCWWHEVGGLCFNALCPDDDRRQTTTQFATYAAGLVLAVLTGSVMMLVIVGALRLARWVLG